MSSGKGSSAMVDSIKEKLRSYDAANVLEEANAIKEILQEIVLYALRRSGFYRNSSDRAVVSL
jgi:hypothetical protein